MEQNQQEALQTVLAGFDGVWARVAGDTPQQLTPAPQQRAKPLSELAAEAARAAAYDRALAGCFRGDGRTTLLSHAGKADKRAARLRGEYFLREGVCQRENVSCPRLENALTALREAMLRDRRAADAYACAAEADPELRELLNCFAAEVSNAAEEKRAIILQCFR